MASAHRGNGGELSCQGRKLEFPKLAEATTVVEEGQTVIPTVDLVVVIDASGSMRDEADTLSKVVNTAIDSAKTKCPSNLRTTYLGIEGTFSKTVFTTTVRNYLTQTAKADASLLKGRTAPQVTDDQSKEDAGRAIEDIATHFDWRPGAVRNIMFLGDEPLEGGLSLSATGQDQEDIEAANRAIEVAKQTGTRVHTYMGTGKYSSDATKHERVRKAIEGEYARVARETNGQFFASQDNLSAFQAMLEKVICGSKTDPRVTTTEFCCCQEYVEQGEHTTAPQ
ncbi:vWA domain-containing protein [Sorangium sp. So ce1151]|uniref:vWA domain-containing protein n=1 Tax=Sorangium sp. So ce1151 TaxID=3133332 RepID=UPI003F5F518B